MSDITVITVVENDPGLLSLMVKSVIKFSDVTPDFIVCDNSNGKNKDNIDDAMGPDVNYSIINNSPALAGGSNRHGDGLSKAFEAVTTKRFAIIEPDCILLCDGWDELDLPKTKMLAAKKGELAGKPFYHVCFIVGSTKLLSHGVGIDFRPGRKGKRSNRSYKSHEDVGHEIHSYVRPDEIKLMEFIDCKSGDGAYFDSSFQSDEFWINGEPVLAHFGRGSNIKGKAIRKGFAHPREQLIAWKKIAKGILDT